MSIEQTPAKKTFGNVGSKPPVQSRGIIAKHKNKPEPTEKRKVGRKPVAAKKKARTIYLTDYQIAKAMNNAGRVSLSVHIVDFLAENGYFD